MFISSEPLRQNKNLPLIVTGLGTQENQCTIKRENGYPLHQIIFSKQGIGKFVSGEHEKIIKEGFFIYLKANEPHRYEAVSSKWSTDWIIFDSTPNHLLDQLGFSESFVAKYNPTIYEELFYKMASLMNRTHTDNQRLASVELYHLLLMISTSEKTKLENTQSRLKLVVTYIKNNFKEQLTLDDLSNLIGITPQHLCKIFKNSYDMTLFDYIRQCRLQKAKELLIETDNTIAEIARQVGYQDSSYFGAHFKKKEGISASVFRGKV